MFGLPNNKYKIGTVTTFQAGDDGLEYIGKTSKFIEGVDFKVLSTQRLLLMTKIRFPVQESSQVDQYRIIEKGHAWNGASIPKPLWWWLAKPDNEKFALASLVHDFLYDLKHNRKESDDMFYFLLRAGGCGRARALTMWSGVRAGGWVFYRARRHGGWFWNKVEGWLY